MVNSTYGKGRQVTDDDLKVVDGEDQSKKLRWEISGIASDTTVTMTAPTSDFNFNTPVFGETTVDKITIDNIVIDGNDISSLSGNLTITPVAGSAVVIDGGVSFDGTVLTGLTDLTSTNLTGTLQTAAQANITSVGALTNITPGADFTLTQNSVVPFTSVESGAIANTLYLKEGNVGIGTLSSLELLQIGEAGSVGKLKIYSILLMYATDGELFFGVTETSGDGLLELRANAQVTKVLLNTIGDSYFIGGNVGIGTVNPGNPLAVNRSVDGIIVDFKSADTVEGSISISGNTVTYGTFVGSHPIQLKDGQSELPIGAVVVSTGEIISCNVEKDIETEVTESEAVDIVTIDDAVEEVSKTVEDKENQIDEKIEYKYDVKTDTKEEIKTPVYGTKTIQVKQFKSNICFDSKTGNFCKLKTNIIKKDDKFYLRSKKVDNVPNKEYFTYMDTTNVAGDKKVYGVWFGKASDDAKGQSFGDDSKPVYLIAQVGLFKIRVTDLNGNIKNGDYLETSSRAMEAQKQTVSDKLNSTIGKAMIDVDWSLETSNSKLGYKWKLIPVTF